MGEVYKAVDSRLGRTVAIKTLPEALASDANLRERFDREARTISQLSHPHICTLFDVGEHDGTAYLVMEYLEGATLADRIARGPLSVDQAIKIATEIASALDKAHRAGVVHRDLKPGNIMLTGAGAKLLDFGLATNSAVLSGSRQSLVATATHLTADGALLGTLQYMAPEQLEGAQADARTDVFAFGAVLYEMLTGRKAFVGQSSASVIGAILRDTPPPVSSVQPLASTSLDRVVRKCLEKDRDARWQTARDLQDELAWVAGGSAPVALTRSPRRLREWAGWAAALAIAVAATSIWLVGPRAAVDTGTIGDREMRLQIATPPRASTVGFAPSPDGRALVYQVTTDEKTQLWLRPLDAPEAQPLSGTEGASSSAPFWSPDGRSIGFLVGNDLKRIDLDSGVVRTVARVPLARGGAWAASGVILISDGSAGALLTIPAGGGDAKAVTEVERPRQISHRFPHFLPDGRHFLFYATGTPEGRGVYLGQLGSAVTRRLTDADSAAVFVAPSHVLFARQGTLWAQRLDLPGMRLTGEPAPLSRQIALSSDLFGEVALAEAAPGLLAFRTAAETRQFKWFDRAGRFLSGIGLPDDALPSSPRLTRDGFRLLFRRTVNGNTDLWFFDLNRNAPQRLTTDEGRDYEGAWAPGDDRLVFNSDRQGYLHLYETSITGRSGKTEAVVLDTPEHKNVSDWSSDGKYIAYTVQSATNASDVWALPLFGDRKPLSVAKTAANEARARFSPDGRWIAYDSNESGQYEVYVRPFPSLDGRQQVSVGGATEPVWRGDSRELYFRAAGNRMMAASIRPGGTWLRPDAPTLLFHSVPSPRLGSSSTYAVSSDGQRFLLNTFVEDQPPITLLLNWKPKN
jgi:Tol biopolymer transport system component